LIAKVHALFVRIVLMLVLISLLSSGQGNDQYQRDRENLSDLSCRAQ
jgi:hypothetical protein